MPKYTPPQPPPIPELPEYDNSALTAELKELADRDRAPSPACGYRAFTTEGGTFEQSADKGLIDPNDPKRDLNISSSDAAALPQAWAIEDEEPEEQPQPKPRSTQPRTRSSI